MERNSRFLEQILSIDAPPVVLDLCWRHRDQLMLDSSTTGIELYNEGELIGRAEINSQPANLELLIS